MREQDASLFTFVKNDISQLDGIKRELFVKAKNLDEKQYGTFPNQTLILGILLQNAIPRQHYVG